MTVRVKAKASLANLVVRPKALGIKPELDGKSATFILDKPCKISFEPDGVEENALAIFAGAPLEGEPEPGADKVVYYGPGVHQAGTVQLQSGWTYWLAGGAYVRGHFQGQDLQGVKIRGRGILDRAALDLFTEDSPPPLKENLLFKPKALDDKRHFIALARCKDILVEGITLLNGAGWGVVPWSSQDLVFRGIKMIADGANSDGIDICGCQRVPMEDLFIRNWDDCVVIKARDFHGRADCSEITTRHSVFWVDLAQGLEIGLDCECAHISRITWQDIDIIHMHHNAAISIHNAGSALVEDVLYEDIRIEDLDPGPLPSPRSARTLASGQHAGHRLFDRGNPVVDQGRRRRGKIRNVRFKNIDITTVDGQAVGSRVAGFDAEHNVDGVAFENLRINGKLAKTPEVGRLLIDARTAKNIRFNEA